MWTTVLHEGERGKGSELHVQTQAYAFCEKCRIRLHADLSFPGGNCMYFWYKESTRISSKCLAEDKANNMTTVKVVFNSKSEHLENGLDVTIYIF